MLEFTDIDSLLAVVKQRLGDARGAVIAIEGHSTVGKSCLSKDLAERLGAARLGTDSYARHGSTAPTYRLKRGDPPVIVEGICLRDTLRGLAIAPKLFIYVRRITATGLWGDDLENYLEGGRPVDELSWTDRQPVEYHLRESPNERTDFVYARLDE